MSRGPFRGPVVGRRSARIQAGRHRVRDEGGVDSPHCGPAVGPCAALPREPLPPSGPPNVCSWRHLAASRRDRSTRRRGSQVTRQSRYVVFQQVEAYLRLGWMVQTPAQPYKVLSSAHPDGQAMRLQNSPGQTRPSTAMEGRAGAIRAAVRPRPLEQAARPEPAQLHAPLRSETFAATRNNARSARKRRRQ